MLATITKYRLTHPEEAMPLLRAQIQVLLANYYTAPECPKTSFLLAQMHVANRRRITIGFSRVPQFKTHYKFPPQVNQRVPKQQRKRHTRYGAPPVFSQEVLNAIQLSEIIFSTYATENILLLNYPGRRLSRGCRMSQCRSRVRCLESTRRAWLQANVSSYQKGL